MKVTRTIQCRVCGKKYDITFDDKDMNRYLFKAANIQNAFPYLTDDERELILSGICGHCYDEMWPEEGDA